MEAKRCPVFVDGTECGLLFTLLDGEAEKLLLQNVTAYECAPGHRFHSPATTMGSIRDKIKNEQ